MFVIPLYNMTMKKLISLLVLVVLALARVYAQEYTVRIGGTVSIAFSDISGATITVNTSQQYTPFTVRVTNVPSGEYYLNIQDTDSIVCAPTYFNYTNVTGQTLQFVCISKPVNKVVQVILTRLYNGTSTDYKFTFRILSVPQWYEVFAGALGQNQTITNGIYTIEHQPRNLVAQIIVKKGGMVVWTGLMFPGQEEEVAEDLRIKFYGAIDNVTYLRVYSTLNLKFTVSEVIAKEKTIYIYPICKTEDNLIVIGYTNATIYYTDGTTENVSASDSIVKVSRKNVAKVICGPVLEFAVIQPQPAQPNATEQVTRPTFKIAPRSTYYTGDSVVITATADMEVSCADGTYYTGKAFTKIFTQPTTCVVTLGDQQVTFSVIERQAVMPQQPTQPQQPTTGYLDYLRYILIIALIGIAAYFLLKRPPRIRKPSKEEEEVEYQVKSALESEK